MSEFHKEQDHGRAFALLFDSYSGIEANFKANNALRYVMIKDKEEKRISSMLDTAGELGGQLMKCQMSAVQAIATANTLEQAIMMEAGIIKIIPQGVGICPTCLAKAIQVCEENLIVLKDIQEATKVYADAKV